MDPNDRAEHFNQISTAWSVVARARQGPAGAVLAARRELLDRYGGAVRRYLLGALRQPDAAEELFQEFALRLLRGELRGADPGRGRFRDFVKGVLFHLMADHYNQEQRRPGPLPAHASHLASPPSSDQDREFVESWRDELLARSWAALQAAEEESGRPYYAVLRFRADHPEMRSPQMAEELSARLGRALTPAAVRQLLHRARERFAELLLVEVASSLETPAPEQVEQELVDLGLFDYCRSALEGRRRG